MGTPHSSCKGLDWLRPEVRTVSVRGAEGRFRPQKFIPAAPAQEKFLFNCIES